MKNTNIELMRLICIFSVISIHMSMGYFFNQKIINSLDWNISNAITALSKFSVPVFFIISSFLFFNKNETSARDIPKKLTRVITPLIFWSFLYWYLRSKPEENNNTMSFMTALINNGASFHLWFLYTFIMYIPFLYIIKFCYNSLTRKTYITIALIAILLISVAPLLTSSLFGENPFYITTYHNAYRPDLLIYAIFTPLIAGVSGANKKINLLIFTLSVVTSAFLTKKTSETIGSPSELFYNLSSIFIFISAFSIFNFIYELKIKKPSLIKIINKLGECSFGVYLCHWLIYLTLDHLGLIFRNGVFTSIILDTMIVTLLSFVTILIVRRVKFLKKIT